MKILGKERKPTNKKNAECEVSGLGLLFISDEVFKLFNII